MTTAATTAPPMHGLRACMLAYTFYETDGRVMRYAEALAEAGAEVDVIALRKPSQPVEEMLNGVRVLRIQERERNEKGSCTTSRRFSPSSCAR